MTFQMVRFRGGSLNGKWGFFAEPIPLHHDSKRPEPLYVLVTEASDGRLYYMSEDFSDPATARTLALIEPMGRVIRALQQLKEQHYGQRTAGGHSVVLRQPPHRR